MDITLDKSENNLKESKNFFIFFSPAQYAFSHIHKFIEVAYVYTGECEHVLNGRATIMKKGDYVIMDNTCQHSYKAIGDEKLTLINCLIYPSFIDSSLSDNADIFTIMKNHNFNFNKELFIKHPSNTVYTDPDGTIEKLLVIMNDELMDKNASYLELIHSCLKQLLIYSMRTIYSSEKVITTDDTIQNILKYINLNYMNDITLQEICNIYNYSMTHMSAKFKKKAGISFLEYLQKIRVENSMKLLSDTNLSIVEIASSIGYKDLRSYYRIFKKHIGTTPGKFRKERQKKQYK